MNEKTVIWSKANCPYCDMAKNFLESKNIKFEERKIDGKTWTREQLFESVPNAKTVPQIFLHGTYIGGYAELMNYAQDHGMYSND